MTGLNGGLNTTTRVLCKKRPVQIACEYQNEYPIKENGTVLIVAQMKTIYLQDSCFKKTVGSVLKREM